MKKKKILISILKEIEAKNYSIEESNYEITRDEFGDLIDEALENNYIKNANVVRGGVGNKALLIFLDGAKLTLAGEEFLEENSAIVKAYRGIKDILGFLI